MYSTTVSTRITTRMHWISVTLLAAQETMCRGDIRQNDTSFDRYDGFHLDSCWRGSWNRVMQVVRAQIRIGEGRAREHYTQVDKTILICTLAHTCSTYTHTHTEEGTRIFTNACAHTFTLTDTQIHTHVHLLSNAHTWRQWDVTFTIIDNKVPMGCNTQN